MALLIRRLFGRRILWIYTIIQWSPDRRYFYFAPMRYIDGIEPLPYNGIALLKMDLTNGEVITILPAAKQDISFYELSISPTGRRLAYIYTHNPTEVMILDLKTGEEKTIQLDPLLQGAGWLSWSESGTELTFQVYDLGSVQTFRLTYDIPSMTLIKSESVIPSWVAEMTKSIEALTRTPTP
jgi:WD40-like Beta Propeller Repeat